MTLRASSMWVLLAVAGALCGCGPEPSKPDAPPATPAGAAARSAATPPAAELQGKAQAAIDKAIAYIRKNQDATTGAVAYVPGKPETRHPAVTAMAVTGHLRNPARQAAEDAPFAPQALEWIASLQKPDGAIFEHENANYCTTLAVSMFAATKDAKWKPVIDKAMEFVIRSQAAEEIGFKPGDRYYGGVGYGKDSTKRDLSNTQFALDAANAAGLPQDHPFFKRAQTFLARTQNHGETNDQVWKQDDGSEVRPGNDGGAIYAPGESKPGIEVLPDGRKVFRSYGSMSYALLKSYVFSGLDRRDPRVRAVARWCTDHFELEFNPGFEPGAKGTDQYQGLYYYYLSMAKALRVWGESRITDQDGATHDWRTALLEKLVAEQQGDGSYVNEKAGRWQEDSPVICTCYAILALEECLAATPAK
jgi:squalene-hopene/tetraprenyl-beta-curcumene cyclase